MAEMGTCRYAALPEGHCITDLHTHIHTHNTVSMLDSGQCYIWTKAVIEKSASCILLMGCIQVQAEGQTHENIRFINHL